MTFLRNRVVHIENTETRETRRHCGWGGGRGLGIVHGAMWVSLSPPAIATIPSTIEHAPVRFVLNASLSGLSATSRGSFRALLCGRLLPHVPLSSVIVAAS